MTSAAPVPSPSPAPPPSPAPADAAQVPSPASPPQPSTPPSLSALADSERQAVVNMVTHSGKDSSEYIGSMAGPAVGFLVALAGSWAVTKGLSTDAQIQAIVPPATATLTAVASSWAARGYAIARTDLKKWLSGFLGPQT